MLVAGALNELAGWSESGSDSTLLAAHCAQLKAAWEAAMCSDAADHSLRRYLNFQLEGISRISDTLYHQGDNDPQPGLLALIDHMLEYYQSFINEGHRAAIAYQQRWRHITNGKIAAFQTRMAAAAIDIELRECLIDCIRNVDDPVTGGRQTYGSLGYFGRLIDSMSGVLAGPNSHQNVLEDLLLARNFNHLGYYAYLQQKYHRESAALHLEDRLAFYQQALHRLTEQPEQTRYVYHADWPSLQTMLTNFVREEIVYLRQQSPEPAPAAPLEKKIPLDLSVAQLACLIRLLFEEGIFGEANLQELFKFLALHFRSKRQSAISAHSLSKEYYSIDQVTAACWRDKLLKMTHRLTKTFFPV